jgi:hypothetical protein
MSDLTSTDCLICDKQAAMFHPLYRTEPRAEAGTMPPFSVWFERRNHDEHYRHRGQAEVLSMIGQLSAIEGLAIIPHPDRPTTGCVEIVEGTYVDIRDLFETEPPTLARWLVTPWRAGPLRLVKVERYDQGRIDSCVKVAESFTDAVRMAVHAMAEKLAGS